jgi:hypothetical protein
MSLAAVDLSITSSGVYFLGDDLESSTLIAADTILLITVSNVVLDLAGHTIRQLNTTANVNGIGINSGLTDVIIQNGKVEAVTNRGFVANINCARITLQNMNFVRCANRALSFEGAGGTIADINILNCSFYQCSQATTADFVVNLNQTTRVVMRNCEIAGSVNATAGLTLTGIGVQLTNASVFEDVVIEGCSAPNFRGFFFDGSVALPSNANNFTNCFVNNNTATGSGTTGGVFSGFIFNTNSSRNVLIGCQVNQNNAVNIGLSGGTLAGYNIVTTSNVGGVFNNCYSMGNTANGAANANSRGFWIQNGPVNTSFINCYAIANSTNVSGANAVGLDITSPSSPLISVVECRFLQNANSVNTVNSFGVRVTNGLAIATGSMFSRNISSRNGTTVANQFNNIAAAAQQAYTTVSMSGATGPFNNAGIV